MVRDHVRAAGGQGMGEQRGAAAETGGCGGGLLRRAHARGGGGGPGDERGAGAGAKSTRLGFATGSSLLSKA